MSTTARRLNCPVIWSQPRATLRTAQGSHGRELADLADDAATGHPGQRATVLRNAGGFFHVFMHPVTTARFYEVAFTIGWKGTYAPPHGVVVDLTVTDTAGASVNATTDIPAALQGTSAARWPGVASSGTRLDSLNRVVAHVDRTALDVTLDATLVWRWTFEVNCGASVYCEAIEITEMSRFALDTAESFGDDPNNYLPRAIITSALSRTGATLEAAYDLNRRTYQSISLEEGTPDSVTAASWAAIPGSQTVTGTTAAAWKVRPRRILSTPAILFGVRYKTSGATAGDVRITTSVGTYTLALPGTSGAWADVLTGAGFLADAATDTITWEAQVGAGTLSIVSYWIVDDPQP